MAENFYRNILEKQQRAGAIPPNEYIASWALELLRLLYPEQSRKHYKSVVEIEAAFAQLEKTLLEILNNTHACKDCDKTLSAKSFFTTVPSLYDLLNKDAAAIFAGDPAAKSLFEVVRTYPGFLAISFYRIAHELQRLEIPLLPRILTEYAHSHTGIDIHPGAVIGEHFCIDHGTGVVIGETSIIGNHVKLYQGVTLGALSVSKEMVGTKRHPTVEDYVVIYSNATILGGETIIGHHSIIGGNVWLTKSVPANSTVYHKPLIEVVENKITQ
ncbi:serine acetyltransferase [Arachidicoccus ginsenosidimutans]|uniref:serine O-acetyltransferase n=1 Tax=Arachidicoccus sp. BS20 TaxID=1850526 RepID=UPI0007F059EB|nr:serine O-acetyltransferase [Arachidicoccus sp. BS20]ANI89110.1 serine acetyltransferase [Arachidicoccus sp. BS20]